MSRTSRKTISNTLGDYLRSLREQRGQTIRKLAIQVDRTDAYINRLELGKRGTDHISLYKLVIALDGDFLHALACLCRDEGIPEEEIARIMSNSVAKSPSRKSTPRPK